MLLTDEEELNFEEIFALDDPNAARQALDMAKFYEQAIVPTENNEIRFDVKKAVELTKQNDDLAIVQVVEQTLTQTNDSVSAMVDQVMGLLDAVLGIALGEVQQNQLRTSIENVFTNLAPQEGDAWIFWSKSDAHKSAYQYNILFAVQNAETGFFLYGLPMGMTITADLSKEQVLFITLKDQASYEVKIESLKVVEFLETEVQQRAVRHVYDMLSQH